MDVTYLDYGKIKSSLKWICVVLKSLLHKVTVPLTINVFNHLNMDVTIYNHKYK